MSESVFPEPPAFVAKRDGQLVPFDADKISRALFAAGESLGRADAFLSRELADGVVHFLAFECEGQTPTTEQIGEVVVKVVRELGQPALAEAFALRGQKRAASPAAPPGDVELRFPPDTPLPVYLASCVRAYTMQTVFTRDLVAAQSAGLLSLTGLRNPTKLPYFTLETSPQSSRELLAAIEDAQRFVGDMLVLDGPEHLLSVPGALSAANFARDWTFGLRLCGLRGVVNLNSAVPPSWAGDLAEGPLFAAALRDSRADPLPTLADELLRELLALSGADTVRLDWHLGERDFAADDGARERLLRLTRSALDGAPLAFAFDRPRRPVALAEGMDRQHPAVLLTVGLHLPWLMRQPGIDGDADKFLHKLGSLARLALSAGVQKREYLRRLERARQPVAGDGAPLTSAFLLDRARLIVAPLGLDRVVREFVQKGLSGGGAALDLGRRIVLRLRDVLRQDGRLAHLDTCMDGPISFSLSEENAALDEIAGLTAWDEAASLKSQMRAAGALHGVAEHGTMAVFSQEQTPEQIADWLHLVWRQSDVVRLRLIRVGNVSDRS